MKIFFKTRCGSEYQIDHDLSAFHQFSPRERNGELFNVPTVVLGKRVTMWTPNVESNPSVPYRVIQTDVVVERKVIFE